MVVVETRAICICVVFLFCQVTGFMQAWTGHCAIVQWHRRPPLTNTGAPFEKMKCFEGTCLPWKCCKVFCALVVTVKTCVSEDDD